MLICGIGLVVMAVVGFNTAFAPTVSGVIGNPVYGPGFLLGGFSANATGLLSGVFWSMTSQYYGAGLATGTYFLFEAAFAIVTLALVGVVVLRKVKLEAFAIFSVVYFIIIWNLPAAWIWNPTGWLYSLGMRDFAGGLVVHGAAAAAGLAIVLQVWLEERKLGLKITTSVPINVSPNWLTLSIVLLWMGWFGFNGGSVLAFNSSAITVVITTFLAAAASLVSLMLVVYWKTGQNPGLINLSNGVLMGLIVITPVAGFVSPASAIILGLVSGPLYYAAEVWFAKRKWIAVSRGTVSGTPDRRDFRSFNDRSICSERVCRGFGKSYSAGWIIVWRWNSSTAAARNRGIWNCCRLCNSVLDILYHDKSCEQLIARNINAA